MNSNKFKHVVIIHKAMFHKRPPVISALMIINSLGYNVSLCTTGISDDWKKFLQSKNISCCIIKDLKSKSVFSKIYSYIRFRINVYQYIKQFCTQDTLLWVEGAYTIVSLGIKLNQYKHILQIQELHENSKIQLHAISKVLKTSLAVFMPEYNRTVLYKIWFKLNKKPYVLPNKPFFIPTAKELDLIQTKYAAILQSLKNKKIILYQGHIGHDRDLSNYVKAIASMDGEYVMVLMGTDYGMLEKYKVFNSNIVHIDYIPAPDYLIFTRMAYIGIVSYNFTSLNNAYCAPNKIWEYASFGCPMIGNDIPGLRYTIFQYGAGESVDETSILSIKQAIMKINKEYDKYSEKSRIFYNSIDNKKIISEVLSSI